MAEGFAVLRLLRHPVGITVIVVTALVAVFMADQMSREPASTPVEQAGSAASFPSPSSQPTAPAASLGGDVPAIVKRFGNPAPMAGTTTSRPGTSSAPGLEDLLAGLESKVRADPANVANRILLAQTYQELGSREKALSEARDIVAKNSSHSRARLVLASILSTGDQQPELTEAMTLLEGLRADTEVQQSLVQMYLGDAQAHLGDRQGALDHWQSALESMPATDNRRADVQRRISNLESPK